MSMAPPFIAYCGNEFYAQDAIVFSYRLILGAIQNNQTLVEQGYQQLAAYHEILYDDNAGMLKHILLGASSVQDPNHWATGNGWATNGMIRVLRIIQLSNFASSMANEQENLISWASTVSALSV